MALRRFRLFLPLLAIVAGLALVSTAGAFHLFPLVPNDPFGDCAAKLSGDPGGSAGHVGVNYFTFEDHGSGTNTTTVKAGDSVTWVWEVPYCHSVQTKTVPSGGDPFSTDGGAGSAKGPPAGQDTLVKPSGSSNSFTVTLTVPGTYEYYCVHHQSVGMVGKVVVN
jgi:plastocyanin